MSIFAEEEVDFARTEINFHRPWLYDKQRDALYDPHRLSLIEASTKAGKTIGCIIWLVEQALAGGGDGRDAGDGRDDAGDGRDTGKSKHQRAGDG